MGSAANRINAACGAVAQRDHGGQRPASHED